MAEATTTIKSETARGRVVTRFGTVVSDKGDKTIKVRNDWSVPHPKYGKFIRRRTILHAHDERNEAHKGDEVEVVACRRMSKTKCWRLVRVVKQAELAGRA